MNILLSDDALDWSPREARLLETALQLAEHGHGAGLVCARDSVLQARAIIAGLPVLELDFARLGWLDAARQLRRFERRTRSALLHTHGLRDTRAAGFLHYTGSVVLGSRNTALALLPRRCRRVIAEDALTLEALIRHGMAADRIDLLDGGSAQRFVGLLAAYRRALGGDARGVDEPRP